MKLAQHIRQTLELPTMIVDRYLEDLSDEELLVRPAESMNHIAWQLGHLIRGEHFHINEVFPDRMPTLPDGFAERHTPETASLDDASAFLSKDEYRAEMQRQREGALLLLSGLSDDDLMREAPESVRYFGPTVGAIFSGEATHWMMHAGQWAVVRRKLGRPPLF